MTEGARLTIVVNFHDMRRVAPRTLFSLSAAYQIGVNVDDYRVVAIDNGSEQPLVVDEVEAFGSNFRHVFEDTSSLSPAAALNRAVRCATTRDVACMIDGARMVTPGLVAGMMNELGRREDPLVYTIALHLGRTSQGEIAGGWYEVPEEERLLESISWPSHGYRLFSIAELAPSSRSGFYGPVNESGCFALRRGTFMALGGYEEGFRSPGGGLANLDLFKRAIDRRGVAPICLLGEATFHQRHGGVASEAPRDRHPWRTFITEYKAIRGHEYTPPVYQPSYVGELPTEARPFAIRRAPTANGAGVLVVGMHRSGTSLATRLLTSFGLSSGRPGGLTEPDEWNPAGYWEQRSLTRFNEELFRRLGGSWSVPPTFARGWVDRMDDSIAEGRALFDERFPDSPWVWKDPRNCLLLPFWQRVWASQPPVVFLYRDPMAVSASLQEREGISRRNGLALWAHYTLTALANLAGHPVLVTSFDELVGHPARWLESARSFVAASLSCSFESKAIDVDRVVAEARVARPPGSPDRHGPAGAWSDDLFRFVQDLRGIHASLQPLSLPEQPFWVGASMVASRLGALASTSRRNLAWAFDPVYMADRYGFDGGRSNLAVCRARHGARVIRQYGRSGVNLLTRLPPGS